MKCWSLPYLASLPHTTSPPQTVLYSSEVLRLPYSVSVFEDRLYWVDWSEIRLFSADKFNGDNIQHVSAGHLVSDVLAVLCLEQFMRVTVFRVGFIQSPSVVSVVLGC